MNKITIFAIVVVLVLIGLFVLIGNDKEMPVDSPEVDISQEEKSAMEHGQQDYLDMQGYYLYPSPGYSCEGGFTDGYRYLDAECIPEERDDYKIDIEAGLAMSAINPDKGLVDNQIVVRSMEFTGRQHGVIVCEEHTSEGLRLDAEHYLCTHERDGEPVLTLGTGKSFHGTDSSFGRWFEADLTIKDSDNDYAKEDYIELLERFVSSGVKINWEDYEPGN